jgi:hypothetical protein
MSTWLETEGGYHVNLDHVRRIRPVQVEKGIWRLSLELDDDSSVTTVRRSAYRVDLSEMLATILPAASGQEALVVWTDTGDDTRPTEVRVFRYPIVGWRVQCHPNFPEAQPILPTDIGDARRMIVLPDGRLLEAFVAEYDSIDAMKAKVLAEAQSDWDHAHAPRAAE